ncbi:hypothetical protein SK128_019711 [Halocaridina rubra]|uniref:Uncharacterized protein n=1 Tax=Halocaridina rubra TaxID=373956 RepID=A0AAN8ZXV3_HALRR
MSGCFQPSNHTAASRPCLRVLGNLFPRRTMSPYARPSIGSSPRTPKRARPRRSPNRSVALDKSAQVFSRLVYSALVALSVGHP